MSANIRIAQAATTPGSVPAGGRTVTLTKPQGGQAITVHLDGDTRLDLSGIGSEKITFVRLGERLVVLFDNQSTVTVEPFFDAAGAPRAGVDIALAPDHVVTGHEFAGLFPISTDQSILPAAGQGGPQSGANFSEHGVIDTLQAGTSSLDLLDGTPGTGTETTTTPAGATNSVPIIGTTAAGLVDEDGLKNGLASGPGDASGEATAVTGSLGIVAGLDTPLTLSFASGQPSLAGLTSGGHATAFIVTTIAGQPAIVGYFAGTDPGVADNQVYTITLDGAGTGSYTFTLLQPLDHPTNGTEDSIDLTIGFTASDATGDAASATFAVSVNDDSPVIGAAGAAALLEGTTGPAGAESFVAVSETRSLAISWGADDDNVADARGNDRSVAFSGANTIDEAMVLTASGAALTSNGEVVTIHWISATELKGVAGERIVFHLTLTDAASGSYTFELKDNIDHVDTGQRGSLTLSFGFTATDADGDASSSTFAVTLADDAGRPVIGAPNSGEVAENTQDTANSNAFIASGPATGSLAIAWGADDANPGAGSIDRAVAFDASLDNYVSGLTSNGQAITYTLSADHLTLTATASSGGAFPTLRTVFTVTLDDAGAGSYTFNLLDNLDHLGASGNTLPLTFGFTATDSDGDQAALSYFTVNVADEVPTYGSAATAHVGEGSLPFVQVDTRSLGVDWNADDGAAKRILFARDEGGHPIVTTGLKSDGVALDYAILSDGDNERLVAFKHGEDADHPVFSIAFTEANPVYTFALYQNLDHASGSGTGPLIIDFGIQAFDGDGDAISQTFQVSVDDTVPTIGTPEMGAVSEDTAAAAALVSASFEARSLSAGALGVIVDGKGNYTYGSPNGWTISGGEGGLFAPANFIIDADGHTGGNVVWLRNGAMLSQDTGEIITAGESYTLRLNVGDRADQGWPGGEVRLVAVNGGTSFEIASVNLPTPADGDWTAVVLNSGPIAAAYAGYQLRIEIQQDAAGGGNQILVDNVELRPAATDTGSLAVAWGADDAASRALAFTDTTVTTVDPNGVTAALTSYGAVVHVAVVGTTLFGYAGTTPVAGTPPAAAAQVFTVTLDAAASGYSFTLLQPLDHVAPVGTSQYLDLSFNFTATDSDGDATTGAFSVRVDAAGSVSSIHYDSLASGVMVNLGDKIAADPVSGQVIGAHTATDLVAGGGHVVGIDQLGATTDAYGGSANDVLFGGGDGNVLYGNGGDDTLIGGKGSESLYGGTGDDTFILGADVTGSGVRQIALGDGTTASVSIAGLAGTSDPISGGSGYDKIVLDRESAPGFVHDTYSAPSYISGIEEIVGTDGGDVIMVSASYASDAAGGGIVIDGGAGNDALGGGAGNDTLRGGAGDDVMSGLGGADTLVGGDGSDRLYGGTGNDTIDGGETSEAYTAARGEGDKAFYTTVISAGDITPAVTSGWTVNGHADGTDALTGIEIVQGVDPDGAGSATGRFLLVGNGGYATIQAALDEALAGDTIMITAGTWSGAGNVDLVIDKPLTIVGMGDGTDASTSTIISGGGFIVDLAANATTGTVSFQKLAIVGAGNAGISAQDHEILGTLALDHVRVEDSAYNGLIASGRLASLAYDQAGIQNVVITNSSFIDNGQAVSNSANVMLFEFDGNATIKNVDASSVAAAGTAYGIQINGFDGPLYTQKTPAPGTEGQQTYDVLTKMGNVTIDDLDVTGYTRKASFYVQGYTDTTGLSVTNSTVDTVSTGWGKPVVITPMADGIPTGTANTDGPGNSYFDASAANGSYTLAGLTVVQHGGQIDELAGTTKAETIIGTNANDQITGLSGDDILYGGDGDDMLVDGAGTVFIGGAGTDTVDFSALTGRVDVNLDLANGGGGYAAHLAKLTGIENLILNAADHSAGSASNVIGNELENVIQGSGRDDNISGLAGDDEIYGKDGNDAIDGGAGGDILSGGAGIDTLRLSVGAPSSTIHYVKLATSFVSGGELNGDQISGFENVTAAHNTRADFTGDDNVNVLTGGNENDVLRGAGGDDTLIGDLGDNSTSNADVLIGGTGNDNLKGGAGSDLLYGNETNIALDDNRLAVLGQSDIALYSGAAANYHVTQAGDGSFRVFEIATNRTDELYGIEGIDFGGNGVDLDLTAPVLLFDASNHLVGTFQQIQVAINAAGATGYTLKLAAHAFNEGTITVDKDVTILGANATIDGFAARGAESVITGRLVILADGVTIDGVRIAEGAAGGAFDSAGLHIQADDFVLTNSVLERAPPVDGDGYRGLVTAIGSVTGLVVTDNLFAGWATGVYLNPGAAGAQVHHNVFTNNYVGLSVDDPDGTSVHDNAFNNSVFEQIGVGAIDDPEELSGQIYDNTFTGPAAQVTIYPFGANNQDITGTEHDDTLVATDKTQLVHGGDGDDTLNGGNDNDQLYGEAGNDCLDGGSLIDRLAGGEGDDTLIGGSDQSSAAQGDTAVYVGARAGYDVDLTTDADGFVTGFTSVTDIDTAALDEGHDTLMGLEAIEFTDRTLNLRQNLQLFDAGGELIGTFDTLKQAVDATDGPSGSSFTIRIAAGTVDVGGSQVVISKDITIDGAGIGATELQADFNTGGRYSDNARGMILVTAAGTLHLSDLTFDGEGQLISQGIRVVGKAYVDHVRFEDIGYQTTGSPYDGIAISARQSSQLTVDDSQFANIGRVGVHFYGATGSVSDSIFTGKGAVDGLDYAIEAGAGAVISVTGNSVTNNLGVASDKSGSAGFLVTDFYGTGTQATFADNTVTNSTAGVAAGYGDGDASIVNFGADNTFTSGVQYGVQVVGNVVANGTANVDGTFDWDGGPGANAPSGADLADTLRGGDGTDTIHGYAGADTITGGGGVDSIDGGAGNDTIAYQLGDGADVVDGGADHDTLTYAQTGAVPHNVYVKASGADVVITPTDGLAGDTPVEVPVTARNVEQLNIELGDWEWAVIGQGGGDFATTALTGIDVQGTDVSNSLWVSNLQSATHVTADLKGGDDSFVGGGQSVSAVVEGGAGIDSVIYNQVSQKLVIDLDAGTAQRFTAGGTVVATDTVHSFENAEGSIYNDVIQGNALANALTGGGGFDALTGRGGADTIDGGESETYALATRGEGDRAVYTTDLVATAITTSGSGWRVAGGADGTDALTGIEMVVDGNGQRFLLVGNGGYATIQAAVDEAETGDTILIANGSYTEQLHIGAGKDGLQIIGESETGVVIHAPTNGLTSYASDPVGGKALFSVVTVTGSNNVALHDLTVDGDWQAGQVSEGGDFNGVVYINAAGRVEDVTIREIGDTPVSTDQVSGNQRGVALIASSDPSGSLKSFALVDSTIEQFQKNGTVFRHVDLTVTGNDVIGSGLQHVQAQNGIQLESGATGTINGNHFSAIGFDGATYTAAELMAFDATDLVVAGNTFSGVGGKGVGIYLSNATGGTVSTNSVTDIQVGMEILGGGTNAVQDNICDHDTFGIYILNSVANVVGSNSFDHDTYGVYLSNSGANVVQSNSFDHGTYGVLDFVSTATNNVDNTGSTANIYTNISGYNHEQMVYPSTLSIVINPIGSEGADAYVGGAGNDTLDGRGGDDWLQGYAGSDTMIGGGGDDYLEGGSGVDTATYTAALTASAISTNSSGGWTVTAGAPDGTDTLLNTEIVDGGGAGRVLLVGNGGFSSIQAAVDAATAGDTILVAAGNYAGFTVATDHLTIVGVGAVTIQGTGSAGYGVTVNADALTLDKLTVTGFYHGIHVEKAGLNTTIDDLTLTNVNVVANGTLATVATETAGLYVDGATGLDGLVVTGGRFDGSSYGWYVANSSATPTTLTDVHVSGTTFNDNYVKGLYAEKLENAAFDHISVVNSGILSQSTSFFSGVLAGIDVNLKYGNYENISISNSLFQDSGRYFENRNGLDLAGALVVKARNDGPYAASPASLTNVDIVGNTFVSSGTYLQDGSASTAGTQTELGIRIGETGAPATLLPIVDVVISGNTFTNIGTIVTNTTALALDLSAILAVNTVDGTSYDVIRAGSRELGNDIIVGDNLSGNVLKGGNGHDIVIGGVGSDAITGGAGDDRLVGDAGDDTFVYVAGDGRDTVDGGTETSADTLDITGDGTAEAYAIWTKLAYNADPVHALTQYTGAAEILVTRDGAIVVEANEIEDITLHGGLGADSLTVHGDFAGTALHTATITYEGGFDADTLDVSSRTSPHRVVADGGDGTDTVKLGFNFVDATYAKLFAADGMTLIGVAVTHGTGANQITDLFAAFESFQFGNGETRTLATLFNSPPTANDDTVSVTEDTTGATLLASTLVLNDNDLDHDTLSITTVVGATHGTANLVGGNIVFTPDTNYSGVAELDYTVSDGHGGSDTAHVTINVAPDADAPMFTIGAGASLVTTPVPQTGAIQLNPTGDGDQRDVSVAALDGGGFVAAWASAGQDSPGSIGIVGQRYSSSGARIGPEFLINSNVTYDQWVPDVTALRTGGFVVTWTSIGQDATDTSGIYGQRYDAGGAKAGDEFLVNTTTSSDQQYASVGGLDDGGFVVAWQSQQSGGGDIYGRRYDANGVAVGGEFQVNSASSHYEGLPSVSALNGGFVVTWSSYQESTIGGDCGIYGRRFDANGTALGTEFHVNTTTANDQSASAVTHLAGGGFVVTWQSYNQDGDSYGVYGQRYDAGGSKAGGEFLVNTATASSQNNASATALPDGGFVVIWEAADGDGRGAHGQRFAADGTKVGSEFPINPITAGEQYTYSGMTGLPLTTLASGDVVAAWWGAADSDVYARIFSAGTGGLEGHAITLPAITAAVTDTDGSEALSLSLSGFPVDTTFSVGTAAGATWVIGASDVASLTTTPLQMTPPHDFNGTITLSVTAVVSDSATLSDHTQIDVDMTTKTISVVVTAVNDLPVADDESVTLTEDASSTPLTTALLAGDSDIDGDTLTITQVTNAAHGSVALNAGAVTYTPTANFSGVDGFDYTVSDGHGGTDTAHVTIDVTPVADAAALTVPTIGDPVPLSGDVVVNSTTAGTQLRPSVAAIDGGYVVTWSSLLQDGDGHGVYAQRYSSAGAKLGGETLVNTTTSSDQDRASVAAIDGGYIVTWSSSGEDGSGYGVYAQRYADNGTPIGGQTRVNTTVTYDQIYPTAAAIDGGYVVTWSSHQNIGGDVYAQRYATNGTPIDGETRINTYTAFEQFYSSVAAIDGGYVVTWRSGSQDGNGYGIYAQRYLTNGTLDGVETRVNTQTIGDQSDTAVTAIEGGYVVTWSSNGPDGSGYGVYAQRFATDGTPLGVETRVNTYTANGQHNPSVAAVEGGYLVTWTSEGQDGSGNGIYAQRFADNGTKVSGEFRINADAAGDQYWGSYYGGSGVTVTADGTLVSIWEDAGEIEHRRIDLPSVARGEEDTTIALSVSAALGDLDGSESLTALALSGVPAGATLSDGTHTVVSTGAAISVLGWNLAGLTFTGAPNAAGAFGLTLSATVADSATLSTGPATDTRTVTANFTVTVDAVNDAPTTTPVTLPAIGEDSGAHVITQAELLANAHDVDSSTLTASNLTIATGGGGLVNNGNGNWSYTPAANDNTGVTFSYTITDGVLSTIGSASLDITPVSGAAALASLDSNGDGVLDAQDAAFAKLLVWQDANADGVSDANELAGLADHDIASITVATTPAASAIDGQLVLGEGTFTHTDGSTGGLIEVALQTEFGDAANLFGSEGDDTLLAGLGGATLSGSGGADAFRFEAPTTNGLDHILDFSRAEGDTIELLGTAFGGLSAGIDLTASFEQVCGAANVEASAKAFVFDTDSQTLYWSGDGAGGAAAVALAHLENGHDVTAADLRIV